MRKTEICVRRSDHLVLYTGKDMSLSEEEGFLQGNFRDPALTPASAAIYEVDSLPRPFGKAFYTYDSLTGGFEPTALGTEKIAEMNKSALFSEAENKLKTLEVDVSEVVAWLISHLLSKSTISASDLPAKVRNWRQDYAATKRQYENNKPDDG